LPVFNDIFKRIVQDRSHNQQAHLLQGCPIDKAVPIFCNIDPLSDKYLRKKTFVGEGYLLLVSILINSPLLAYETRNNGDFFQDVYAQEKYYSTQTQKTDSDLYFHNDRTAHEVRPDYIHLLGMRCDPLNYVETTYVDGCDLLKNLTRSEQDWLGEIWFRTPFDSYSTDSNTTQLYSDSHSILIENSFFRYYDTRTTTLEESPIEAWKALVSLKNALQLSPKIRVCIKNQDLLMIPNRQGLHSRNIINIVNKSQFRERYLLKTYNFFSKEMMDTYNNHFKPEISGLVAEQ
jgi:L-asparagine oxygenase